MQQLANTIAGDAENAGSGFAESNGARLLSVGVIVDLFQGPSAGGHVKTWEKIARAACDENIDLTVYFFGEREQVQPLSENVRYLQLPPVWNTGAVPFLKGIPADTDLAPLHFRALSVLRKHDVLHATDAYFSMARAARRVSRQQPTALVHSTHTDTPGYTRIYSDRVIRRVCGEGWLGKSLCERWQVPSRLQKRMQRRLERYARSCDWVMVPDANPIDSDNFSAAGNPGRISILRRGIDRELFHPRHRNRERLQSAFGIPPDRALLLFVGRIDAGKDVMTPANAARVLLDRGLDVHLICAGEGIQTQAVRELLGPRVALPGQVNEETLRWLYASADVFVFGSKIEVFPNVVLEAKASGLPVIVSAQGGSARLACHSGAEPDGITVSDNDPAAWADAIAVLLNNPEKRRAMGEAARQYIENSWPSWQQVLREDLLPIWQRVARERRSRS